MMLGLKPILVAKLVRKDPLPDLVDDRALGKDVHVRQATLADRDTICVADDWKGA